MGGSIVPRILPPRPDRVTVTPAYHISHSPFQITPHFLLGPIPPPLSPAIPAPAVLVLAGLWLLVLRAWLGGAWRAWPCHV